MCCHILIFFLYLYPLFGREVPMFGGCVRGKNMIQKASFHRHENEKWTFL